MSGNKKSQSPAVKLRKQANLTQRQVAQLLDVREATVSEWERGLSIPTLKPSKIKRMMEVYGCSLDDLIQAFENKETE